MDTLLLYPPITDPTSGYHSLCYLETYARQQGFQNIEILDVNIEALHYTMRPEQVEQMQRRLAERKFTLQSAAQLKSDEQMELNELLKAEQFDPSQLDLAVQVMQNEAQFYDYECYRHAAEVLTNWMNVLSLLGYPGQFQGFTLPVRSHFNLMSSKDMSDPKVIGRIMAPFEPYLRDVLLPRMARNEYGVVGINVTYCAQLPFALAIGRMIRETFPETVILYGGTEVSDVWKYLSVKSRFFDVFDAADACVVGEGERAFTDLLGMVERGESLRPLANTLLHPRYGFPVTEPDIEYLDITELPTPDYGTLPWDLYLSPHDYVYYSPSRGCYWNKCTFCDYGLNFDSPTSPWRQNSVEKIIEDLRSISKQHRYVYFSVDVLAPAMLLHLAEQIVEEGIEVRWGAEIRLEKYWSPERCALLMASGCTDISMGFESGNQRILDLIDKGTQVPRIQETIRNFREAGIGVQMMGFTGFPTESFEEAMESVTFLRENRQDWTFGGLGSFVLTPGAIVAKHPERFELQDVKPMAREDIVRQLYYVNPSGKLSDDEQKQLKEAKQSLAANHFNRPWVGGVDTAHTMFYHDRYGIGLVQVVNEERETADVELWYVNGTVTEEVHGFRIAALWTERDLFDLHKYANDRGEGFTAVEVERVLGERVLVRDEAHVPKRFFLRRDGRAFPFPDPMLDFLAQFETGLSRAEFFDRIPESEHAVYNRLWEHSLKHRFLCTERVEQARGSVS